jgi:hypothetical protein
MNDLGINLNDLEKFLNTMSYEEKAAFKKNLLTIAKEKYEKMR